MPTPYLLVGTLTVGAALVALVPVMDERVLEWIVTRDPGPRLDPLLAAAILFGPASVALASASPIAVRLAARSLERLGRTAGRLFSVSTAGSIAGTFATAFWLVPELGTDQVLAVGATTLLVAALAIAVTVRLRAVSVLLAAAIAGALALTLALSPERGGQLSGVAARNWSPLYRIQRDRTPGPLDPAAIDSLGSFTVREARETRYHRLVVADDDDSRFLRFDSSFQSGMWLSARTEPVSSTPTTSTSASRTTPARGASSSSASAAARRRSGCGATSRAAAAGGRARPGRRHGRAPVVCRSAGPRLGIDVSDGRRWLKAHGERWDVIALDASMPTRSRFTSRPASSSSSSAPVSLRTGSSW